MNELEAPEGVEQPEENLEDVSPSFKESSQAARKKAHAKPKAAKAAPTEGLADKAAKKGLRQLGKQAALAVGRAIASAFASLAAAVGWPWLVGCLVIFLIIVIIFGGLGCSALNRYFAGSLPVPAGKNNKDVIALIAASKQKAKGDTYKFELPNKSDQDFLESGQIDERLAAALNYLVQKHDHIRVSHIVSGYEDMNINPESGNFHDAQISKNISAHKRGEAADIDEIDYVKKKCDCGDEIPVNVGWQAIGENPYGPQIPDVLNEIQGPNDLITPEVRQALANLGVTGLDQDKLIDKIMASAILANIKNVNDLTNPDVIAAFEEIGVQGVDNDNLQKGLKRYQALQALYELNPQDINALRDPNVQKLFADVGVPISNEVLDSVKKYQASQVLADIKSVKDLENPDVQNALKTLNIDPADPKFQEGLKKTIAAQTILNWRGDPNNEDFQEALKTYNMSYESDLRNALDTYAAIKYVLESDEPILSEAVTVAMLNEAGIKVDSPEAQKAIKIFKAGNKVLKYDSNYADPNFWQAVENLGIAVQSGDNPQKNQENAKKVIDKFRSAQYIFDYQGDYTNPEFINALNQVGISLGSDEDKKAVETYKAAVTLSQAAKGELSYNSQEVKDALKTVGAATKDDPKAKAAEKIGAAKDPNDPSLQKDREILGMTKSEWQTTLKKAQSARTLLNIRDFDSINDPKVQEALKTLNLDSPNLAQNIETLANVNKLLHTSLGDIKEPVYEAVMLDLAINDPKLYDTLGRLGDLRRLSKVKNLMDLKSEKNQQALKNLGINNEKVAEYIGQFGDFQTLLNIKTPLDLTKPEVIQALGDLKIVDEGTQQALAKAGSVYTLSQIREPKDLLQPQNLQALSELGIINLNAEFLGQIAAVQTLLQVRDLKDLLNPSSILALNTLGIISLSNPVTSALMVISFVDNLMGGKLIGGLFGKCKGSTGCYKTAARGNVHTVIGELLQMPYDLGRPDYYSPTQLITYSEERDVLPFSSQLDALYGAGRPNNLGLFAMPEAAINVHIGY